MVNGNSSIMNKKVKKRTLSKIKDISELSRNFLKEGGLPVRAILLLVAAKIFGYPEIVNLFKHFTENNKKSFFT